MLQYVHPQRVAMPKRLCQHYTDSIMITMVLLQSTQLHKSVPARFPQHKLGVAEHNMP